MDNAKLKELKQRAKSAFGFKYKRETQRERKYSNKENKQIPIKNEDNTTKDNNTKTFTPNPILSPTVKTGNYFSTNYSRPESGFQSSSVNKFKNKTNADFYSYNPFLVTNNAKNIININNKLIDDLNSQINSLNEKKKGKKFNYKQTVNLQKLNDYIIYEYTKNKMQVSKENNKKPSTSFLLPLPYRRMGNHGKKEDLIPINNKPKVNLEDILILHNTNLRNSMTRYKVQNYYIKNYLKYKKNIHYYHDNKYYPEEIALKYINIL
jgi:hypothetical protein